MLEQPPGEFGRIDAASLGVEKRRPVAVRGDRREPVALADELFVPVGAAAALRLGDNGVRAAVAEWERRAWMGSDRRERPWEVVRRRLRG